MNQADSYLHKSAYVHQYDAEHQGRRRVRAESDGTPLKTSAGLPAAMKRTSPKKTSSSTTWTREGRHEIGLGAST
ncbi:MAG: hypothetical protein ACLSAH_03335 [Bilophila wadsworthia]